MKHKQVINVSLRAAMQERKSTPLTMHIYCRAGATSALICGEFIGTDTEHFARAKQRSCHGACWLRRFTQPVTCSAISPAVYDVDCRRAHPGIQCWPSTKLFVNGCQWWSSLHGQI